MSSTYTTRLRAEKQGTGENSGTWGTKLNTLIAEVMEEAIAGVAVVSMSDANYTLTTANGASDEARRAVIRLTGALTATRNVVCPSVEKLYVVFNNTSGGQSIVFKTSAGSGITVLNGAKHMVYCDGTNVVEMITELPSGTTIGGSTAVTAGSSPQFTAIELGHASDTTIARVSGGLVSIEGSNILTAATGQPLDATLTAFAGQTTGANLIWYWTGTDAGATTSLTAFGRSLIDDADAAAGRATLGLTLGTSGATVPLLNGDNTHSGSNTFNGAVVLSSGTQPRVTRASQSAIYYTNAANTTGYIVGRDIAGADAQNFFIYDATATAIRISVSGNQTAFNTSSHGPYAIHTGVGDLTWNYGPSVNATSVFYVVNSAAQGCYLVNNEGAWTAVSDERVKTIYGEIPDALTKALGIRGVYYNYDRDDSKQRQRVGVVAQDVLSVLPEAVDSGPPDVWPYVMGVRYTELVPLLFSALKELSAKVDALEARLA